LPGGRESGRRRRRQSEKEGGLILVAQSIPEAVKAMKNGDIASWVSTSDSALSIGQSQRDLSDDVAKAVEELRQAYSGKGADAAINRLATFGNAVGVSSDSMIQNADNVQQTAAFYKAIAAKMEDIDPPAQKVFASPTPWGIDSEAETKHYNQIQAINTQAYMQYDNYVNGHGISLQTDYGQLKPFDAGTVSIDPGTTGTTKSTTGTTSRTTAGQHRAPDTVTGTTPGSGPGQTSGGVPGGSTPGVNAPEGVSGPVSDGTGSAAFRPPATLPGGGVPGGGGVTVPGPGSTPGGGFAGDLGPFVGAPGGLSGTGPGGGSGTGSGSGSGRVPGAGSGQAPGAGVRSGAGALEGESVRGGRGLAGSRVTGGSGGPGGMAPCAGKGKGDDDKEHKRRYGLDEVVLFPDDDESNPDSGIDPTTGMRVTKPTIG
jgi:hypothetical protein